MQNRVDTVLAAPPVITTSLHVLGVPLTDVVIILNVLYVVVLLWLKLPEVIERLRKKGGSNGCAN